MTLTKNVNFENETRKPNTVNTLQKQITFKQICINIQLPDSISWARFATYGGKSYGDGCSFSDGGKKLCFTVFRDVVGNFEITERTCGQVKRKKDDIAVERSVMAYLKFLPTFETFYGYFLGAYVTSTTASYFPRAFLSFFPLFFLSKSFCFLFFTT